MMVWSEDRHQSKRFYSECDVNTVAVAEHSQQVFSISNEIVVYMNIALVGKMSIFFSAIKDV